MNRKRTTWTEESLNACEKINESFARAGILQQVEYERIANHLYRAKKLDRPATLTVSQWLSTVRYFRYRCAYCLKQPYGIVEHFVSLSAGGGTTADNCVPACQSCNVRKTQGTLSAEALHRVQAYLEGAVVV